MSFGDFGPFGDYRYPPGTGYLPGESSKEVARENFVQDWLYSDEYDSWCDGLKIDPDDPDSVLLGEEHASELFEDKYKD